MRSAEAGAGSGDVEGEQRRRGRPRNEQAHAAVIEATAKLLRDGGLPAVTIEAVSAASGISKPTIYRYWPNRTALAIDAFGEQMTRDVPIADTGDTRRDLIEQVRNVADYYTSPAGAILAQLLGAGTTDSHAAERIRNQFFSGRRAQTRTIWERAQARGHVRPGIDADTAIDILFAPIIFRLLVGHAPIDSDSMAALADYALSGLLLSPS